MSKLKSASFKALIFPLLLPLTLSGCQTVYAQKQVTILKDFDRVLMLSRDNQTQQLYFQSKNSEPKGKCGNYWYSDFASVNVNDEQHQVNLNQLFDIASLKLDKTINNEYYLFDNNHRYTVILTLCDNMVTYENSKNSPIKR